jgi:hypothetical protein
LEAAVGTAAAASKPIEAAVLLVSAEAASWAVGASPLEVWALPVVAPEVVLQQRGAAA